MSLSKCLAGVLLVLCGCGATGIGTTYSGEGTYYGATGGGACSYDPSPQNLMVAAMNAPQWDSSAVCGMCV